MYIDIYPLESQIKGYRGLERLLSVEHFNVKKGFEQLLEMYFDYISYNFIEDNNMENTFHKIFSFYTFLIEKGIQCEMVISDKNPIDCFCSQELKFLGIDIVNQYHESLLLELFNELPEDFLNINLLCKKIEDYDKIEHLLKKHEVKKSEYESQYIYKIL
jgi:hypothetical protein